MRGLPDGEAHPSRRTGAAGTRRGEQRKLARRLADREAAEATAWVGSKGVVMFTDGSARPALEGGGMGAGLAWKGTGGTFRSLAAPLGILGTNGTAELQAILIALDQDPSLLNDQGWPNTPTRLAILSDSEQGVKSCTENSTPTSPHAADWMIAKAARKAIAQLTSTRVTVRIRWIPGHTGQKGNTCADAAARIATSEAAGLPKPKVPRWVPTPSLLTGIRPPVPVSTYRLFANARAMGRWDVVWRTHPSGKLMQHIKPHVWLRTPERVYALVRKRGTTGMRGRPLVEKVPMTRREQVVLERLRLGNATHNARLHQHGLINSNRCDACL